MTQENFKLWELAEQELAKHGDEYYDNELIPFPTVQDAVDAITETAYFHITASWIGDAFIEEVARRLLADAERRNKEFADSSSTTGDK